MQCKLHGLAIGVLILITACSDTSQHVLGDANGSSAILGEVSLSVPRSILAARAIDQSQLFAVVVVNGNETRLAPGELTTTIMAEPGTTLNLRISWFETQPDGEELLLAEREISEVITRSTSINVDNYDTGVNGDSSVNPRFDADGDGFSNLAERRGGTDPFDDDDDEPITVIPVPETPGTGTTDPGTEGEQTTRTAFDVIAASADHTVFARLLRENDLDDVLDDEDPLNQFTIFAPTDAAFDAIPDDTLSGRGLSDDELERILNHHVVRGALQSGSLFDELVPPSTEFSVDTLADDSPPQALTFTSNDLGLIVTDGRGNRVQLNDNDLNLNAPVEGESRTGIVHVVDSVLMPVPEGGIMDTPTVSIKRIDPLDAPVIDGLYDSSRIWDSARFSDTSGEQLSIDNLMIDNGAIRSDNDAEMRWFAMHDGANLYVYIEGEDVSRATPFRDSINLWDDDNVNLFIDGDNSKGLIYDGFDDRHLFIPLLTTPENPVQNSTEFANGSFSPPAPSFDFASCRCTSDQHTWEFSLPLSEFNIIPGRPFGFDVQIDLDHDGGSRDARWGWAHPSRGASNVDNTWRIPSFMGTVVLE